MPLRMAGQYADDESGLFYNYFRYYNPKTGQYLRSDPIGLEGGLNTYGYVGGSPVHYVDPMGLRYNIMRPPFRPNTNTNSTPGFYPEPGKKFNRGKNVIRCGGWFRPCGVVKNCKTWHCPGDPVYPDNQCPAIKPPRVHHLLPQGMTYEEAGCKCTDDEIILEENAP